VTLGAEDVDGREVAPHFVHQEPSRDLGLRHARTLAARPNPSLTRNLLFARS
jgi:hypothetical protein